MFITSRVNSVPDTRSCSTCIFTVVSFHCYPYFFASVGSTLESLILKMLKPHPGPSAEGDDRGGYNAKSIDESQSQPLVFGMHKERTRSRALSWLLRMGKRVLLWYTAPLDLETHVITEAVQHTEDSASATRSHKLQDLRNGLRKSRHPIVIAVSDTPRFVHTLPRAQRCQRPALVLIHAGRPLPRLQHSDAYRAATPYTRRCSPVDADCTATHTVTLKNPIQ